MDSAAREPTPLSLSVRTATSPAVGPRLVVFSGGTAFNSVVRRLSRELTTRVAHVMPISDNGGSTREILRVLGGPAIGDIRSRLIRLAASGTDTDRAVAALLKHRLPERADLAQHEFLHICDGTHTLWRGVPEAYKQTLRAFLVHFFQSVLHCASVREVPFDLLNRSGAGGTHGTGGAAGGAETGVTQFDFGRGSVGNFVFTARVHARLFSFSTMPALPLRLCRERPSLLPCDGYL